jgi:CheY-like chemotaxis protein/anti-sigma regulatory factor (Ser/Thr protein kinase)
VIGDATEIREVVTNLLKNAIDAVEGGGTVRVDVGIIESRARITVSDTGVGIPPDILPKLFTPFFTTKGDQGTGLGLCLCQQIVDRHAGTLKVASEVGVGTQISVDLPLANGTLLRTSEGTVAQSAQSQKLSVLVVDDDPNVLSPLCEYLRQFGFSVDPHTNAERALNSLDNLRPDVVLSDVVMPGMDGIQLCRSLQRSHPTLPVILMSGQASAIDSRHVQDIGAAAVVAKPFTMRQIVDLLRALPLSRR